MSTCLPSFLLALCLLAGCAPLQPIRDFGGEAARAMAHPEVPRDFSRQVLRLRRYGQTGPSVDEAAFKGAMDRSVRFQEAQAVLTAYARALGALADGDLASWSTDLKGIGEGLGRLGLMEPRTWETASSRWGVAAGWVTDATRRRLIRELLTTCDPAVQTLVTDLVRVLDPLTLESLAAERQCFDDLVAGQAMRATEGQPGVPPFVAVMADHYREELLLREARVRFLVSGLQTFAEGHHRLAEGARRGDFRETLRQAGIHAQSLRRLGLTL